MQRVFSDSSKNWSRCYLVHKIECTLWISTIQFIWHLKRVTIFLWTRPTEKKMKLGWGGSMHCPSTSRSFHHYTKPLDNLTKSVKFLCMKEAWETRLGPTWIGHHVPSYWFQCIDKQMFCSRWQNKTWSLRKNSMHGLSECRTDICNCLPHFIILSTNKCVTFYGKFTADYCLMKRQQFLFELFTFPAYRRDSLASGHLLEIWPCSLFHISEADFSGLWRPAEHGPKMVSSIFLCKVPY